MIQIIMPGTLPRVEYFGTCSNCGCQIKCEFEDHDTKEFTPSRHKNSYIRVKCPTVDCHYHIQCKQPKVDKPT